MAGRKSPATRRISEAEVVTYLKVFSGTGRSLAEASLVLGIAEDEIARIVRDHFELYDSSQFIELEGKKWGTVGTIARKHGLTSSGLCYLISQADGRGLTFEVQNIRTIRCPVTMEEVYLEGELLEKLPWLVRRSECFESLRQQQPYFQGEVAGLSKRLNQTLNALVALRVKLCRWPSQAELGEFLGGLPRRTVGSRLSLLEATGYIQRRDTGKRNEVYTDYRIRKGSRRLLWFLEWFEPWILESFPQRRR